MRHVDISLNAIEVMSVEGPVQTVAMAALPSFPRIHGLPKMRRHLLQTFRQLFSILLNAMQSVFGMSPQCRFRRMQRLIFIHSFLQRVEHFVRVTA